MYGAGGQRQRARGVGVDEVEPLARRSRPAAASPSGACTVFQPMCGSTGADSRSTVPGHCPQPLVWMPCSTPSANSTCMPDADAQHRARPGQPAVDHLVAADRPQPGHAGGERADPGHHQPVGRQRGIGVRRHVGVRAGPHQRPLRRTEVARTVVQHHDPPRPQEAPQRCPAGSRPGAGLTGRPWCWARRRPRVGGHRRAQRPGHRLELGLNDVVRVAPGQHAQVQADARRGGQRLEEVPGERGVVGRRSAGAIPSGSACTR